MAQKTSPFPTPTYSDTDGALVALAAIVGLIYFILI